MASNDLHLRTQERAFDPRVVSSTVTRCATVIASIFLLLLASFSRADATVNDQGYYVEATSTAYSQLPVCNAPECTHYAGDGGQAYTSDYAVAQMVEIFGAQDGETYLWEAIKPDNTVETLTKVTYSASTGCYTWATGSICPTQKGAPVIFWDGPSVQDEQIGTWTLLVLDNGETDCQPSVQSIGSPTKLAYNHQSGSEPAR